MWQLNYNIHDLLTVKIQGSGGRDPTRNLRYSYFAIAEDPGEPDILLNIGPFEPQHNGAEAIAHKYYVKENYFYCAEKGSKSKWKIEVFGFETGKTVINFDGRRHGVRGVVFPTFMAQEFLMPFIEYKLAKNHHFLIHGGAVCKDSQGYLLTGRPGVWKTSLLMDVMRTNEYQFLGDDRVILGGNGSIFSFPTSLFLFNYTYDNTRTENRSPLDDIRLLTKILLSKAKDMSIIPTTRCENLGMIVFVARKTSQAIQTNLIGSQEALEKLIINNMAEYVESKLHSPTGQYNMYVQIYSLIFPDNDLLKHQNRMIEGLKDVITNVPIREFIVPLKYNKPLFDKFIKSLKK